MKKVKISSEFITLGQFLKLADVIQSGGEAKSFLADHIVLINGEKDNRRGRKLRHQDVINLGKFGKFEVIGKTLDGLSFSKK